MPNAYEAEAKDGVYMPLKLSKTSIIWQSPTDMECWAIPNAGVVGDGNFALRTTPYDIQYPFPGLPGTYGVPGTSFAGYYTAGMLNDMVGSMVFKNISSTAGLIVTVRMGLEIQVEAGTLLAPFVKASPVYDPVALKSYAAVSRELKDAYPVSYNDLGHLWDSILSAVGAASPVLASIHPGLGLAATAFHGLGSAVTDIVRKKKSAKHDENQSATQKEATQKQVAQVLARPNPRRRAPPRPQQNPGRMGNVRAVPARSPSWKPPR